jgi:hypothetical protein
MCGDGDAFVAKLNDEGKLVYATYLGGGCLDYGTAIAVDLSGNAYVTGLTTGAFPTTSSTINNNTTCSEFCGFVAKVNATGSSLVYSDYLGELDVNPSGIAVDVFGHAYVTGTATIFTTTPNSFEPDLLSLENFEPFVAEIDSSGDSFVYSTYLAGQICNPTCLGVWGHGLGIAVDLLGHAYVTGTTMNGFPTTPNTVQPIFGGDTDAFVAKLNTEGSGLIYSTYLGGVPAEWGFGIEVDLRGNAYVLWGSVTGALDAKVSRLNPTGSSLINFGIGSQQSVGDVSTAIDYSGSLFVATVDGSITKISTKGKL